MTSPRDDLAAELFGLAGTFPRPGWVVLDAARDHRFTGELVFETTPAVRMYMDRGRIYLAERVTDPSLGARLVDAGALNAAQLERGAMRFGDHEHLGRLFERVPSVDRHAVLVTTEMMTEECVGWLAGQTVRSVEWAPYRHHTSGVHRWDRPVEVIDLHPGDPLPAPEPHAAPIEVEPPEPLFAANEIVTPFDDDILRWNEPSLFDERPPTRARPPVDDEPAPLAERRAAPAEEPPPARSARDDREPSALQHALEAVSPDDEGLAIRADWVDRLSSDGLPRPGSDPLTPTTKLPPVAAEPPDRFEIIWPSGEVDDQFIGGRAPDERPRPDIDRAGPTARVARGNGQLDQPVDSDDGDGDGDVDDEGHDGRVMATPGWVPPSDPDVAVDDSAADDVVLAVRRAVASIETGGLAARRRLAGHPSDVDTSRGVDVVPPGRVAVRDESSDWSPGGTAAGRRVAQTPSRSVFDDLPPAVDATASVVVHNGEQVPDANSERTGALRRLIGGLRRR